MRPEVAYRRIESFGKRFGEAHLHLAYHAAFPLALTPDLLYHLWANFQRDIHGKVLGIPWIAVADLLLSSLCDEVGHELYEMDAAVRNALLSRLKEDENLGQHRIKELSDFLLNYVQQQLHSPDPDLRDFAQAQHWIALAYTQPSEAASELAVALERAYEKDRADLVRLASLVKTLAEPLAEFEPLLIRAHKLERFAYGNQDTVEVQFDKLHIQRVGLSTKNNVQQSASNSQSQFTRIGNARNYLFAGIAAILIGLVGFFPYRQTMSINLNSNQITPGSYQGSCKDISVENGILKATCVTSDGKDNPTDLLNFEDCQDIANNNGSLECQISPRSYKNTCKDISIENSVLRASCQKINGQYKFTELPNYKDCKLIENVDGSLVCRN